MKSALLPLFRSAVLRRIEARHADLPLMQRAGAAAARWAMEIAADRNDPVLIVAGPGNNGGDAFVAATLLRQWGQTVEVVFSGEASRLPNDAAAAHATFLAAGGQTSAVIREHGRWRLIIDGLFGIGLSKAIEGQQAEIVARINRSATESRCPVLALDCPSGLDADTGCIHTMAVRASHTLTFIGAKPGLFTAHGPDYCGQIRIDGLDLANSEDFAEGSTVTPGDFLDALLPRARNSHKGSYGSAGILGGAHSMLGAAFLAGRAALRLGAGRVYLGLLAPDAPAVDSGQPELMLRRPEGLFGPEITALACGPGLGNSLQAAEMLEHAINLPLPLVLDADAINLLAYEGNLQTALATRAAPTLLTPHPAEAARLMDVASEDIQSDRIAAACDIAARFRCHVALKGCGTVITDADGNWRINTTGNPGLATAGSGDVLTGMAVSLLAQGWPMAKAALAAVHLHGAAAEALVETGDGPVGLTASELIAPARRLMNRWIALANQQ